jgi:hypothetical protein
MILLREGRRYTGQILRLLRYYGNFFSAADRELYG